RPHLARCDSAWSAECRGADAAPGLAACAPGRGKYQRDAADQRRRQRRKGQDRGSRKRRDRRRAGARASGDWLDFARHRRDSAKHAQRRSSRCGDRGHLMVNAVSPVTAPEPPKPKNAAEAARQFEAILIAQMLHNARPDDEDSTTETMW